ncbi:MAG: hypothetical protein GX799_06915 [Crenarchaeota archaeon]|nr:hypothetical protein [Thermoproteota archaeon]
MLVVPRDYFLDDIAVLRAIQSKAVEDGMLIYDPKMLKVLQDNQGLYSLSTCVSWKLSIQQKFLAKHDEHEVHISNLLTH